MPVVLAACVRPYITYLSTWPAGWPRSGGELDKAWQPHRELQEISWLI